MRGSATAKTIGIILLVIGGLNWGLVGLFNFDLVAFLLGPMSVLTRITYVLVGIAAVGVGLGMPALCGWGQPCETKSKHPAS